MPPKKKAGYICKSKVECLECGKVILSENQKLHSKISHNGSVVKYKWITDAKQPKLQFSTVTQKDLNSNQNLEIPDPRDDSNPDDPASIDDMMVDNVISEDPSLCQESMDGVNIISEDVSITLDEK